MGYENEESHCHERWAPSQHEAPHVLHCALSWLRAAGRPGVLWNLWRIPREDPMYSWQVDGADRQAPHESPEDLHAWGEPTQSEIIIEHLVHPGVDIKALYEKA